MMGGIALLTLAVPHVTFICRYLVTNWNVFRLLWFYNTQRLSHNCSSFGFVRFPHRIYFSLFTVEQYRCTESVSFLLKTFHFSVFFTDPQYSQQDQGTEKGPEFFCKLHKMWLMHLMLLFTWVQICTVIQWSVQNGEIR